MQKFFKTITPPKGVLVYSVIYIIMATVGGPRIIRSGLVLNLDATQKTSYSGSGTTWNDLSTSKANFTLGCTGTSCTNPTFSNNAIKTSFTASINNYADCNNVSTTLKNLLYGDHTIEIACKINSLTRGIDLNAAYTTESITSMIVWPGYHSGVFLDNASIIYGMWNGTTNWPTISTSISSYVGRNIIVHAIRISNTLYIYINGILGTSSTIAAPTNYGYNNLRLGTAITSYPVNSNGYAWPSNIDYYAVRLYNIGFNQSQINQNYNTTKGRFGL